MPVTIMEGVKPKLLPIIFLIDTSASMEGLGISQVNNNLKEYIDALKIDEQTEEVVLTIVTFNSTAKVMIKFEPIQTVVVPLLTASGSTNLADGIRKIMEVIQEKAAVYIEQYKRPLLVFISDGNPDNDKWREELQRMNAHHIMKRSVRVALGAGNEIKDSTLEAFILNKEVDKAVKIVDVQRLNGFFTYLRTITTELTQNKPLSSPVQSGVGDSVKLLNP